MLARCKTQISLCICLNRAPPPSLFCMTFRNFVMLPLVCRCLRFSILLTPHLFCVYVTCKLCDCICCAVKYIELTGKCSVSVLFIIRILCLNWAMLNTLWEMLNTLWLISIVKVRFQKSASVFDFLMLFWHSYIFLIFF